MLLKAKVKVENLYKSKDFKDKESGEVVAGKWKIQTFEKFETAEGMQMKLIDISIPEEVANKIKDKIGQEVEIPVGYFAKGGRVFFYGLKD